MATAGLNQLRGGGEGQERRLSAIELLKEGNSLVMAQIAHMTERLNAITTALTGEDIFSMPSSGEVVENGPDRRPPCLHTAGALAELANQGRELKERLDSLEMVIRHLERSGIV